MLMKESWGSSSQLAVKLLHSQFGKVPTEGTGSGLIIKEVLDTNSLIITIISQPLKTNLHSDR